MKIETNRQIDNQRSGLPKGAELDRRFSVAPMMDWTDRHCRAFHRLLTKNTLLYTEMVTALALIHGPRERLLAFDPIEQPVALQIGGSDPKDLAQATKFGDEAGYAEINLNVGCPSDRVQSGRFGACLMAEPDLVAECMTAMMEATDRPVTIKCRIGIDDQDSEKDLNNFVEKVAATGVQTFIVHARKAWLSGLSPKENREIPPLNYDRVYRLKQNRPQLEIIINGGIENLADAKLHLTRVDGVMMGRAAYHLPWTLSDVDAEIYGAAPEKRTRCDVMQAFMEYIERELGRGTRLHQMTRHILGLYHGQPGARAFRRHLSENACREGAGLAVLQEAISHIKQPDMPIQPIPATGSSANPEPPTD